MISSVRKTLSVALLTVTLPLSVAIPLNSANSAPAAPAFSGETLRGEALDFKPGATDGKPTLLVFWASWCRICMVEVPRLKEVHAERSGTLNILGINLDKTPANGLQVVQERQLPYPSIKDGDLLIADQYDVHGTPTLYVISASGEVVYQTNRLHRAIKFLDGQES
tara:strand:+ start:1277 stop:1774 length:498 start_codon:yes stop_codon:yes gene_type:complete